MTKTKAAYLLSAQSLFELGRPIYFWTFTFKNVYPDWWYPQSWRKFCRDVGNMYGGYICGLRVLEAHQEHGLHYHLLVDKRLNIHTMRRLSARVGMFWIRVERKPVDFGSAIYLSKYLIKDGPKLFGLHRWGTFGCFHHTSKSSVEIDSPYMRLHRNHVKGRLKIGCEELLRKAYDMNGRLGFLSCLRFLELGDRINACLVVNNRIRLTEYGGLVRVNDSVFNVDSVKSGCYSGHSV